MVKKMSFIEEQMFWTSLGSPEVQRHDSQSITVALAIELEDESAASTAD